MARILYVDIETSPNLADVWGLWDQNVSLDMLRQSGHIMGFAYRWGGGGKARWVGEYNSEKGDLSNRRAMLEKAWQLYNEADIVVTYNGNRFDNPYFNTEWIKEGMTPPAPVLSLDLFATVKRKFRFPSNKLDYVCMTLLGDRKVKHAGYQMWKDCLDEGVDPKVKARGWRNMSKYARQDVDLLEPLHDKLRPWLPNTINVAVFGRVDEHRCGKCNSVDLERRGFEHTAAKRYQRFRCRACGAWSRGTAAVLDVLR